MSLPWYSAPPTAPSPTPPTGLPACTGIGRHSYAPGTNIWRENSQWDRNRILRYLSQAAVLGKFRVFLLNPDLFPFSIFNSSHTRGIWKNSGPFPDHLWHLGPDPDHVRNSDYLSWINSLLDRSKRLVCLVPAKYRQFKSYQFKTYIFICL